MIWRSPYLDSPDQIEHSLTWSGSNGGTFDGTRSLSTLMGDTSSWRHRWGCRSWSSMCSLTRNSIIGDSKGHGWNEGWDFLKSCEGRVPEKSTLTSSMQRVPRVEQRFLCQAVLEPSRFKLSPIDAFKDKPEGVPIGRPTGIPIS